MRNPIDPFVYCQSKPNDYAIQIHSGRVKQAGTNGS